MIKTQCIFIGLIFLCTNLNAAITCSATTNAGKDAGSTTSTTLAYGGAVAAGDLLLAGVYVGAQSRTVTVTDSVNGSVNWNQDVTQQQTSDGHQIYIFSFPNSAAGTPTVSFSFSSTAATLRVVIASCSGLATSSPLDQTASGQGNASTPTTGATATRTVANELLFAFQGNASAATITQGSSFNLLSVIPTGASSNRIADEYQVVSAVGTDAGTFNPSQTNWSDTIATYKILSTPVTGNSSGMEILGGKVTIK